VHRTHELHHSHFPGLDRKTAEFWDTWPEVEFWDTWPEVRRPETRNQSGRWRRIRQSIWKIVKSAWAQRPILNFAPRGKLWPPGVKFSVRPSILLNSGECSPLWVNKRGWTFPLGDKFHPWGPGIKLRMALCSLVIEWSLNKIVKSRAVTLLWPLSVQRIKLNWTFHVRIWIA
jgi:hypothetical protein